MAQIDLMIAGVGGQGSILAGEILGTAAVSFSNKFATQTQAYSSELRGGYAATWVIISDDPVLFPRVKSPDILVAQAQDSIERYAHTLKPEGVLIIDSDMVKDLPGTSKNIYEVPATYIARHEVKIPITANIVMLGALCKVSLILERSAFEEAILKIVPRGKEDVNMLAFDQGFNMVKKKCLSLPNSA
jgi:2-oxoglutarate ferredoxin oxidoreductase subunit gamma